MPASMINSISKSQAPELSLAASPVVDYAAEPMCLLRLKWNTDVLRSD